MTMDQFIAKANPFLPGGENEGKVGIRGKIAPADLPACRQFIADHRAEIIARLNADMAAQDAQAKEQAARAAASVQFYSTGFESHDISIDTREDIDAQLRSLADYHSNDCTYDSLKADYERALAKRSTASAEKQAEEGRIAAVKAKAAETGEKQPLHVVRSRRETSYDTVYVTTTTWAMPDGTTTKTDAESR